MIMDSAMSTTISSSVLSPGCNSTVVCHGREEFGWSQFSGQVSWKRICCQLPRCTLGGSNHSGDHGAIRNPFSQLSDRHLFSARKNILQMKVRAAADYSDSMSDPLKYKGGLGYHPLEALHDAENSQKGELTLTDAEIARTVVEVNNSATLMFSGMVDNELHENIFWSDLQYVTDEYGDIYFQVNDEEDVLQNLSTSNSPVHVLIGLDNIQYFREQETTVPGTSSYFDIEATSDTDSDIEDDYEEGWIAIVEEEDSDLSDSLGDWAGLETMRSTHPVEFSGKLAEVVSTDYSGKMDCPSKGLAILGLIRPAFMEEQSSVHKFLYDEKIPSTDIIDLNGRSKDEQVEEIAIDDDSDSESLDQTSLTDAHVSVHGSDNDEGSEMGTSLYKLEILHIQLVSFYGNQSVVSLQDFQQAEPDILAHSASTIIARINSCGKKTKTALKSLCRKIKGIEVEETTIIGVDSLGIDVRVRSGTQVQTLRFAFSCRATSEYAAEKQLRQLLFPRSRRRRQKQHQTRHQNN